MGVFFSWFFLGPVFATTPLDSLGGFQVKGCTASQESQLRKVVADSCSCMHKAADAARNHRKEIHSTFEKGVNFRVFGKSPDFYTTRFENRSQACLRSSLKFKCVGECNTAREREAYVWTPFGFVGSTIYLCDEFFPSERRHQEFVMLHEFGRLEDVGDDEELVTNNIAVWDRIVGGLCTYYDFIVRYPR